MKKLVVALVVLLAVGVGGGALYVRYFAAESEVAYRTATVKPGDITPTISATGTLQAEDSINVGVQVAGRIISFGTDTQGKTIDFNSVVEKGMKLAFIDPESYLATVEQAKAAYEKSQADVGQYTAKLEQCRQEKKRAEQLRTDHAISGTDFDAAVANFGVAEASLKVAQAAVKQSRAALDVAETNYRYTTIESPVRGKIIDRRVNIGQTVVASLNAPSLFLIAKDLTRMQIWVSVNEADYSRVYVGMPVRFTVDTYPDKTFHGQVAQVRLNAQMTSNVVNYMVIVAFKNVGELLPPYMTASVLFEEKTRAGVLTVPNAALQFRPKSIKAAAGDALRPKKENEGRLWVQKDDGTLRPILVTLGVTDGAVTEVSGKKVKEGMVVVTEEVSEEEVEEGGESNPFMPKFPKGHRPH
jgi:HlyD family secretion protein